MQTKVRFNLAKGTRILESTFPYEIKTKEEAKRIIAEPFAKAMCVPVGLALANISVKKIWLVP